MSQFPTSLPTFTGFTSSHTLSQDSHASQHNSEQAEIIALATKIGTGVSTPTAGTLYRGTGAGTSAWAQAVLTTDVTGVLPQANGGTGTTLATGTGKAVYDTSPTISGATLNSSPTIITPTIVSFTNAQHNHQNAAGGGQLTASAITSLDFTNTALSNPYKFSVYRNAALNSANTPTAVAHDSKLFDTSSNVDVVTNKGRFTAPVSGFYFFSASAGNSAAGATPILSYLYKNGSRNLTGNGAASSAANGTHASVTGILQLSAGDFVEHYFIGGSGSTMDVGSAECWFHGEFRSNT